MDYSNTNLIIISPKLLMRGPAYGCNEQTKDDWLACEYGKNLSRFGFKDYFIFDVHGSELELYNDNKRLDRCTITGNQVSIVNEKDVYNYNPYFKKWFEEHPNKTIKLENFTGKVDLVENVVIGIGNINFKSYVK